VAAVSGDVGADGFHDEAALIVLEDVDVAEVAVG
jgi:hypothetical protein